MCNVSNRACDTLRALRGAGMPFETGRVGTKALGKAELLTKSREERAQREAARSRAKAALLVRLSLRVAPLANGGGQQTQLKFMSDAPPPAF